MTATVLPRMPARIERALPRGACDTHAHVFGPSDAFPTARPSSYPLPDAPAQRHREMLDLLGLERGVLVQPAPYGTDPSCLLDALDKGRGALRGVAVASAEVSDAELLRLDRAGVRGLRFVEMRDPSGNRYPGSVPVSEFVSLAPRMKELGWHAQIWARGQDYVELLPGLVATGVPIVLDHMACLDPAQPATDGATGMVLRYLSEGAVWVKLALCRQPGDYPHYAALHRLHQMLVAANPQRVLWGSDWPYVRMGAKAPDVGVLLDRLIEWLGNDERLRTILSDNPVHLYGFDADEA